MKFRISAAVATAVGAGVSLDDLASTSEVVLDMDGMVRIGTIPTELDGQLFLLTKESRRSLILKRTAEGPSPSTVWEPPISFNIDCCIIGRILVPADGAEPRLSCSYLLYPDRNLGDGACDQSLRKFLVAALGVYFLNENQRDALYIGDADSLVELNSLTAELWNLIVPERLWDVVAELNVGRGQLEQYAPQVMMQLSIVVPRRAALRDQMDRQLRAAEEGVRIAQRNLARLIELQQPQRERLSRQQNSLQRWENQNSS